MEKEHPVIQRHCIGDVTIKVYPVRSIEELDDPVIIQKYRVDASAVDVTGATCVYSFLFEQNNIPSMTDIIAIANVVSVQMNTKAMDLQRSVSMWAIPSEIIVKVDCPKCEFMNEFIVSGKKVILGVEYVCKRCDQKFRVVLGTKKF